MADVSITIDSPNNGAWIWLTDKDFVLPQPKDFERRPPDGARKLKVSGSASGIADGGTVEISISAGLGSWIQAPLQGGKWSIDWPITVRGPLTIKARKDIVYSSSVQITLIELKVDKHKPEDTTDEKTSYQIAPGPNPVSAVQIPCDAHFDCGSNLQAVTQLAEAVKSASFEWTLQIGDYYRCYNEAGVAVWKQYGPRNDSFPKLIGTAATTISPKQVIGGWGKVTVKATLKLPSGQAEISSDPVWINIGGDNPDKKSLLFPYIETALSDAAQTIVHTNPNYTKSQIIKMMALQESSGHQFVNTITDGCTGLQAYPSDSRVPTDLKRFGMPNTNCQDAGIGVLQHDDQSTVYPDEYWNWRANVDACIREYDDKHAQAVRLLNGQITAINNMYNNAKRAVDAHRHSQGLGPDPTPAPTVTPPPNETMYTREAMRLYNGGRNYRYDLAYIASPDSMQLQTVGSMFTGYWVGNLVARPGSTATNTWIERVDTLPRHDYLHDVFQHVNEL